MITESKAYRWLMENRERIFSFTFAVVALVISSIIASGFRFDFNELTKVSFYVKTVTNFFIMITLFNAVKTDIVKQNKLNPKSEYYDAHSRTNFFVKKVHDEHLEMLVDEEVTNENQERFKKAQERELNKYVIGLSIEDGCISYGNKKDGTPLTEGEFFQLKGIKSKKKKKKVRSCIYRALKGEVYYIEISTYEVLNGFKTSRRNGCDDAEMSFNESKENVKENGKKIITFVLIAVATAIIGFDKVDNWWLNLLGQCFVMLSACMSAVSYSYKHIEKMTKIEINRATFLNNIFAKKEIEKIEKMANLIVEDELPKIDEKDMPKFEKVQVEEKK